MSRTFNIRNSQYPKVMNIRELLNLQPSGFIQYDRNEEDEGFEEAINLPLNEYGSVLMGQDGVSGRGFEVSYDNELGYGIRCFTPCTEEDWLGAFEFIKNVARYLNVQVVDEEGNVYEANNINYNYHNDIEFGLKCHEDEEGTYIFGVNRPVCFNSKIIQDLKLAENKVGAFSKFMREQQYVDGFIANQKFYQKSDDENIIGIYTITEGVPTVLPYQYPPFIDITKVSLSQEQVSEWRVSLVKIDGDDDAPNNYEVMEVIDYPTFLENLPENKKRN